MTVARKTEFTPGREIGFSGRYVYLDAAPYSESNYKRGRVAQAREHDRDSSAGPFVRLKMDHFERVGRRLVQQVALDSLAQLVGTERGSALQIKPDEELRRKIQLYKEIQGAREAAYAALDLSLGTAPRTPRPAWGWAAYRISRPGVKTPTSVPRATHLGGHIRRPPD